MLSQKYSMLTTAVKTCALDYLAHDKAVIAESRPASTMLERTTTAQCGSYLGYSWFSFGELTPLQPLLKRCCDPNQAYRSLYPPPIIC